MSEYYNGPPPPPGWEPSGIEQCDVNCLVCKTKIPCKIVVKTKDGGIERAVTWLITNKVAHICEDCFNKMNLKLGPLPRN